ncbi:thioredoxin domain-containing protein [Candidatus Kaiserbacteria bacterium]|nr:thioredoxin domain-containing protein [Candidatus Kaiserbacteria bacterium]
MTENIQTKTPNNYLIPLAIVIAGGLVAGAVFMSNGSGGNSTATATETGQQVQQREPVGTTDAVRAVTKDDHIKGNLDAAVTIVEYSDFECPFCKRFHDTMNEVIKEVDDGQVAWVFRHFPLDQLHPVKARAVAVASECAGEQGGNESFWKFSDRYMELTLSNNKTPIETVIPQIVQEIGLNESVFQTCFESGKYDQHIEDDTENAIATGGRGTPWSVVIAPNGKTFPLNGAQPLEAVKQLINLAAQEK